MNKQSQGNCLNLKDSSQINMINNMVNSIGLSLSQKQYLLHLIMIKKVGHHLSVEALTNWCLRMADISVKVIKCLEYTCWANKRGQVKIKRYYSSGTMNNKRIVNNVIIGSTGIQTESYRISLALGEVYEVVTYHDLEAISKSFCDHYFISNMGRISNTRFPQPRYTMDQIIAAAKKVSQINVVTHHTHKDFLFETCHSSRNNRIRMFIYDIIV
jgi:hypothetical protein